MCSNDSCWLFSLQSQTGQTGRGPVRGRELSNCHYQPSPSPAINYYANSIYLSRDVPLLFRNEDIQPMLWLIIKQTEFWAWKKKISNHWLDVLLLIRSNTLNGAGAGGGLDHSSGPLPLGYSAPDSALLASNYYNGGLYSDHDNILGRLSNQTRYFILHQTCLPSRYIFH